MKHKATTIVAFCLGEQRGFTEFKVDAFIYYNVNSVDGYKWTLRTKELKTERVSCEWLREEEADARIVGWLRANKCVITDPKFLPPRAAAFLIAQELENE